MKTTLLPVFLLLALPSLRGEGFPSFRPQVIDPAISIGYGLAAADVDGDGKTDLLLADKNQIVWYANPDWKKHVIAENLTAKDNVCIAARDIDGDGKCEIAVGAEWNPGDTENSGAVFYLVAPADRTGRWGAVRLQHEPTTHRMKWVRNAAGKFDLVVLPLHGRGNKNGAGAGVKVLAYSPPTDVRQPWTTRVLMESMHLTHNLDVIPAPADAAESILVCGREGVARLDPAGEGWKEAWITRHDGELKGAGEVRYSTDSGGRNRIATIEPMHGNQVCLYTPGEKDGAWTRTVLDEQLKEGHALGWADFAGDGIPRLVAGWRGGATPGVKLFAPPGPSMVVDSQSMACEDLLTADLDGDGDPDLVAAGRATKNVVIYWNLRLP